jgi:acyl-CoA thioesterase-2
VTDSDANSTPLDRLLPLLELERSGDDAFTGQTSGRGRLFGGLVAAQSLLAAGLTVDVGPVHSLHAYFLRPGRNGQPIRLEVLRMKDGRNFAARNVLAWQGDEIIFTLHASFARPEPGISHQPEMPDVPGPEGLPTREELRGRDKHHGGPVDIRVCPPYDAGSHISRHWIRMLGDVPDDPLLHSALVTYASDRALLSTGSQAHDIPRDRRRAASLDHAVWFHRPVRFDDWLYYEMESPTSHAARAFVQGAMYTPAGDRVVSVAQEGLIRLVDA